MALYLREEALVTLARNEAPCVEAQHARPVDRGRLAPRQRAPRNERARSAVARAAAVVPERVACLSSRSPRR